MLPRSLSHLLKTHHFSTSSPKMAFLVGPRQSGKTTLARSLQKDRSTSDLYRNWDDLNWRREFTAHPYQFVDDFRPHSSQKPLAVLDEIHKFPRWKTYLKGLWDTRKDRADFLVTGSGRLDVYRRGGDSLLGRYHQYRLHPFSVSEALQQSFDPDRDTPDVIRQRLLEDSVPPTSQAGEAFTTLLTFGGFPDPFLRHQERHHRLWTRERRERLVREDLRDLTRIHLLSSVEQLIELLPLRIGSLLSLSNLRNDLGVSLESVRLWMDQLERLYYCYRIRPFAGKLTRTLSREPKVYLYDWSELREEAHRLENLVASALLRWCHFTQDWGQTPLDLHFVRDKEKREVDFLLTQDRQPFLLIEVKLADTNPGPALEYFSHKLNPAHPVPTLLVVGHLTHAGRTRNLPVVPAASFLSLIP